MSSQHQPEGAGRSLACQPPLLVPTVDQKSWAENPMSSSTATAQGKSWDKRSSFSTQTCPSGAPTCPTEQTCDMKHYQKHPRHSPQHFQSLAFCYPSLTAGSAGLWECRGWHKPLWVLCELGSPAPPLLQRSPSNKQEPTPCDTALTKKTSPPATGCCERSAGVSSAIHA